MFTKKFKKVYKRDGGMIFERSQKLYCNSCK
jgi:hypothetical protein